MIGENDLSYYHDIANLLNQKISDSKKIIIPNSGHMTCVENTEAINRALPTQLDIVE